MRPLRIVIVCWACVLLVPLVLNAQEAQPSGSISGTVIDAVTKQPVASVEIRARNLWPGYSGPHIGSATSDSGGHFVMDALPEGRYFIFASREGYVSHRITGTSSRWIMLTAGQHINDLTIELTPGAAISGHIKSIDGKPLAGVSVEVLRYFQADSGKQLRGVGEPVSTGAGGDYRISNLPSGEYYLHAVPSPKSGDPKSVPKEVFAPTYYPNALDVASATALTVHPGSDAAGVDITLTAVHAVTVTGRVLSVGPKPGSTPVQVSLISSQPGSFRRDAVTDARGNFRLQGVTSGDYTLVGLVEPANSTGKALWGQRSLHVGTTSIHNADLRIGTGVQVSGRIQVNESATVDFTHLTAALSPQSNASVTTLMPSVDNVNLMADGSFTFNDVPEGKYLVEISPLPQGYFLKSNSTADFIEDGISISNSQSPPTLDLTLSPDAPQVTGSVLIDDMPAAGAWVVLTPQGNRRNQTRFSKRAITDSSGRFSIKGIVPGDYKILAFQVVERNSLSDPAFLERFDDRGETVHLREGDAPNLSMDAIPADESVP
jgi:hypothetical protein